MARPLGPRKVRPVPETKPTVTLSPIPAGFANATTGEPNETSGWRPGQRRGVTGVDRHHCQVGIEIGAAHRPRLGAPIGERDGHLLTPQIVGVGEDLSLGDDYPCASPVAADPNHRRPRLVGHRNDHLLHLGERHLSSSW